MQVYDRPEQANAHMRHPATPQWIYAAMPPIPTRAHRGAGVEFYPHPPSYSDLYTPVTSTTTLNSNLPIIASPSLPNSTQVLPTNATPNSSIAPIVSHSTQIVDSTSSTTSVPTSTNASTIPSVLAFSSNTSIPIMLPMSNSALPYSVTQRQREIYEYSDSEDEVVEYVRPKRYISQQTAPGK